MGAAPVVHARLERDAAELAASLRRIVAEEAADRAFAARVLREMARFTALRLRRGYPLRLLSAGLRQILREHAAVGAAPADLRGYVCRVLEGQLPRPLRRGWTWQRAGTRFKPAIGDALRRATTNPPGV